MIKAKNGGREEHNKHRQCKRKEHNSIYNAGSMVQSKIKYYKSLIKIFFKSFFFVLRKTESTAEIYSIYAAAQRTSGATHA